MLHRRNRFANLDRIVRLDPEVDADEILTLTSRHDFPWDYQQGTGIAFMRDYGIPSIAALLDRTGEFTAEVPTSATGHFRFFAGDGEWTLRTLAPKAEPVDTKVTAATGSVAEVQVLVPA